MTIHDDGAGGAGIGTGGDLPPPATEDVAATGSNAVFSVAAGGEFEGDRAFRSMRGHITNPNRGFFVMGGVVAGGALVVGEGAAAVAAVSEAIGPVGPYLANLARTPVGLFLGSGGGGGLLAGGANIAQNVEAELPQASNALAEVTPATAEAAVEFLESPGQVVEEALTQGGGASVPQQMTTVIGRMCRATVKLTPVRQ